MALGNGAVIVSGARTPIGKMLGGLSELSATQLGGVVIRAALDRAPGGECRIVRAEALERRCFIAARHDKYDLFDLRQKLWCDADGAAAVGPLHGDRQAVARSVQIRGRKQ